MTIQTNAELLVAIRQAEMCADRLTMRGHHLTIGERAVIARLLKDLAGVARSRFDPEREPEPDQYLGGDDVLTDLFGHTEGTT